MSETSLLSLFTDASVLVKAVMLLLLTLSIMSWTLIFQKQAVLRQAKKALSQFKERFDLSCDIKRLYEHLRARRDAKGVERIFQLGLREYVRFYKHDAAEKAVLEGTERAMRVALSKEEEELDQHLPFLATVGSISVYIGLFGTVWGIMTAFRALGNVQQATLAMVAPGISEALVATALGLFAAIPAVFAFNRYQHRVENLMRDYDNLAEEFLGILSRRLYAPEAPSTESPFSGQSE